MKKEEKYTDEQNEKDLAKQVSAVIREIDGKRKKVTAGGNMLKSSPYGNLKQKGLMNADFLLSEFEKIQNKQSSLSSGERKEIEQIVMEGFSRLMVKREKEEANKKKEEK